MTSSHADQSDTFQFSINSQKIMPRPATGIRTLHNKPEYIKPKDKNGMKYPDISVDAMIRAASSYVKKCIDPDLDHFEMKYKIDLVRMLDKAETNIHLNDAVSALLAHILKNKISKTSYTIGKTNGKTKKTKLIFKLM